MNELKTSSIEDAVRQMEQAIRHAVEGALCVFERQTGIQPRAIEVVMSPYLKDGVMVHELDVVRCELPGPPSSVPTRPSDRD